jgi:hypothetical protein
MLLADAAQAVGGKLYILGGGWSVCGPAPTPMAIGLKIEVPWDRANASHTWQLDLRDGDGIAIDLPDPEGELQPVQVGGTFEVGRPPGLKPGTGIDFTLAINFGPLPLPPGQIYEWILKIDDETEDEWRLTFQTRRDDTEFVAGN